MKLKYLSQNSKMKKASLKTYNFDLPAIKTCPFADKCKVYCYATKGFYQMPSVKAKFERNLEASKLDNFVSEIQKDIDLLKEKGKIDAIRIHSSGDFYNENYLDKWIEIIANNQDIVFYAYTKSLPYFNNPELKYSDNFKVIFSEGGKYDHLIEKWDLRRVKLVDQYSSNAMTSDSDDSMILFSDDNIEIIRRW